jgi:peroxiredoxin
MMKSALQVGDEAPDFTLPDLGGNPIRLADFRGKRSVVMAFYVRAGTPG